MASSFLLRYRVRMASPILKNSSSVRSNVDLCGHEQAFNVFDLEFALVFVEVLSEHGIEFTLLLRDGAI